MMRIAIILATLACGTAAAQERVPRFADYPEPRLSNARVARPVVPKQWDEDTRLRFRDAVSRDAKPNFAGRYCVAKWSCGAACVSSAIIEAKTGRVIDIPFTISGWRETHDGFEPVAFRHNSRLIVFSGERNEMGDLGMHFYVLENGKLRFLDSIKQLDGNFLKKVE